MALMTGRYQEEQHLRDSKRTHFDSSRHRNPSIFHQRLAPATTSTNTNTPNETHLESKCRTSSALRRAGTATAEPWSWASSHAPPVPGPPQPGSPLKNPCSKSKSGGGTLELAFPEPAGKTCAVRRCAALLCGAASPPPHSAASSIFKSSRGLSLLGLAAAPIAPSFSPPEIPRLKLSRSDKVEETAGETAGGGGSDIGTGSSGHSESEGG